MRRAVVTSRSRRGWVSRAWRRGIVVPWGTCMECEYTIKLSRVEHSHRAVWVDSREG